MIYQSGERITLVHPDDPYHRVRPGEQGTVRGQDPQLVHVDWDNGSRLSVAPDTVDRVRHTTAPRRACSGEQVTVGSTAWQRLLETVRAAGHQAAASHTSETTDQLTGSTTTATTLDAVAGTAGGEHAAADTPPRVESANRTDELDGAAVYAAAAGSSAPSWASLNSRQRVEAVDAYLDGFTAAVEHTTVTPRRTVTGPTDDPDLSHLHPDRLRLGDVGVFVADGPWYIDAGGQQRLCVGFVGTLIDVRNGWAVFTCTRPVAEGIVVEHQKDRRRYCDTLRAQGVPDQDVNRHLDAAMTRLSFDGDVIVADSRGMSGNPQDVERITPDSAGAYVVLGGAWCWQAVDPATCDRIIGDLPVPTGEHLVAMTHTPGMRVPHDRLRLEILHHWPRRSGLAYVAALMYNGRRVATVGNDGAGGGTDVVLCEPTAAGQLQQYLQQCRFQGAPIDGQRLLDALADEVYFAGGMKAVTALGWTDARLINDDGYTLAVQPIFSDPQGEAALRSLGTELARTANGGRWHLWDGNRWKPLPTEPA